MTQPDQYFPDTAVNALSFADYSATTQEDWESQIHADLTGHFATAEGAIETILMLVDQIPFIGPIISDVAEFILAIFGVDIDAGTDWEPNDIWGGVPFWDWLADMFSPGGSGQTPVSALDQLGNSIKDLLDGLGGLFDLDGSTPPLGTGTPTQTGDTEGPGGGTVTGVGSAVTDPMLSQLLENLIGAGAFSSNTVVPKASLTALTPGASDNVQPDPDFAVYHGGTIAGNGEWEWDWPGASGGAWGSSGCVRTVRRAPITIYWCNGTWQLSPGMSQTGSANFGEQRVFVNNRTSSYTVDESGAKPTGDPLIDWTRCEFICVPYPATVYPMGASWQEGTSALAKMIRSRPGKFILMGHSQGGAVISNILDELRYGTLQDRYDDLLFGVGIGSMRRAINSTFDDDLNFGGDGFGIALPTLKDTPTDKWWEVCFTAGTYPAHGEMEGVTYSLGDEIGTLGPGAPTMINDPGLLFADPSPSAMRSLVATSLKAFRFNELDFIGGMAKMMVSPTGQRLQAVLSLTSAHNVACWEVQPRLGDGDERTCWEMIWDKINSLAAEYEPAVGVPKQLLGKRFPVKPLENVRASCMAAWTNIPETAGDQIVLAINAYDADGELIGRIGGSDSAPGAAVVAPVGDSGGWNLLEDVFVMPEGTVEAELCFEVGKECMTTGIVWFDKGSFEPTGFLDARLLQNIEALQLTGYNIEGAFGQAEMVTAYRNLIDSMVAAATGQDVTGTDLAALLTSIQRIRLDASEALELARGMATGYQGPIGEDWQTSGTFTFDLPLWASEGDLIDVVAVGGGGGGHGSNGAFDSQRGAPGGWITSTLVCGVDVPTTTRQLTITVGSGGSAGPAPAGFGQPGGKGGNGGASSVSGTGMTTITADGGLGGGRGGAVSTNSPGNVTHNGIIYPGGHAVHYKQPGAHPGGGGGNVKGFDAAAGGVGAAGAVWVVVRKPSTFLVPPLAGNGALSADITAPNTYFDALGAGDTGGNTLTWEHNITGNALVVAVAAANFWSVSAQVDETGIPLLGRIIYTGTATPNGNTAVFLFGLLNPPTGWQTISVSVQGTGINVLPAANSVSYFNVDSFGDIVTGSSLTVSANPEDMVVAAFGSKGAGAITDYSQQSRWNQPGVTGVNVPLVIGDAAGGGEFTVTAPAEMGGIGVPLIFGDGS